jgi:hypothetical protein
MVKNSEVVSCCRLLWFLLSSCSSSRVSSSGRRCSPPKGLFGSLPLQRRRVLWYWYPPSVPNLHQQFGAHLVERLMTMWDNLRRGEWPIALGGPPSSRWRDLRAALAGRRRHASSSSSMCYLLWTLKPPSELIYPDSTQRTPGQCATLCSKS